MIIACVRTGTVYHFEYVVRLRNMVERNAGRLKYDMVCLTDQPERCSGVSFIDVAQLRLPGWWTKMALFETTWRRQSQVVYLDLDTVVLADIAPLAGVPGEFSILRTPVPSKNYPCRYNSSVMVIGSGMSGFVWERFEAQRDSLMQRHSSYGDQAVVEELYPAAPFLQDLLPKGFFINYRAITNHRPAAAVVTFGGRHKPHLCEIPWVQKEWC